jgi:hypothetical protein
LLDLILGLSQNLLDWWPSSFSLLPTELRWRFEQRKLLRCYYCFPRVSVLKQKARKGELDSFRAPKKGSATRPWKEPEFLRAPLLVIKTMVAPR